MAASRHSDLLLRALRRQPVERTPVWFMRQAGRSLPEYRKLRGDRDILETCKDPELAIELTLQPLRRMPLDAAILFSDIMVPLAAIGVPLRIEPGRGPVIDEPLRSRSDIRRLRQLERPDIHYLLDAIAALRDELRVPLIGFAGAPFTLASYLVEGAPTRDHSRTKALMWGDPGAWRELMERLTNLVIAHLRAQIEAGADVVQIFDTWVGALTPADYRDHVQPHVLRVFESLRGLGVPTVHFGVGTGELLTLMADAGGDAIGVDHSLALDDAWSRIGRSRAIQGNLDPAALLAPWDTTAAKAREVLTAAGSRNGHVFNLGHGVLPDTRIEQLQRLVDLVHTESARSEA